MSLKIIAIAASSMALIAETTTAALAQTQQIPDRAVPYYYYGHDMMWGGGLGMVLGPIFMILLVVGIVAGVIYLSRLSGGAGPAGRGHAEPDRALALLKERYAKGEIDSAEFAERKKLLVD